jgi:hypothetical protein
MERFVAHTNGFVTLANGNRMSLSQLGLHTARAAECGPFIVIASSITPPVTDRVLFVQKAAEIMMVLATDLSPSRIPVVALRCDESFPPDYVYTHNTYQMTIGRPESEPGLMLIFTPSTGTDMHVSTGGVANATITVSPNCVVPPAHTKPQTRATASTRAIVACVGVVFLFILGFAVAAVLLQRAR